MRPCILGLQIRRRIAPNLDVDFCSICRKDNDGNFVKRDLFDGIRSVAAAGLIAKGTVVGARG